MIDISACVKSLVPLIFSLSVCLEFESWAGVQRKRLTATPFCQTSIHKSNVLDSFIRTMAQQSIVLFAIKIFVVASISNVMEINYNNCTLNILTMMLFDKFHAFLFLYFSINVIYFCHLHLTKFEFTWMIFIYWKIIYGSYDKWYPIVSLVNNLLNIKWDIIILLLIFDLKIEIMLLQHDLHILKYKNMMEKPVTNVNVEYYQFVKYLNNDVVLSNLHVILLLVARNNDNMVIVLTNKNMHHK